MSYRATFLVAVVLAVAGVAWNLARQSSDRSRGAAVTPASEPLNAGSVEKWVAALPLDAGARDDETRRSEATGIDCTRGVACPIIWSPARGR